MQPELWRNAFHDELDDDGGLRIAGEVFLRRTILRNLALDTYNTAFEEWCEMRTQELMEKANDYLGRFDTITRFKQLQRAYRTGNVIPFVGAGMSVRTGYPGWTTLLRKLREESSADEASFEALLAKGDYEGAAQLVHDALGPPSFNEHLENHYREDAIPAGPIQYLPIVFPNCNVVTTNFDRVVETVFMGDGNNGFDGTPSGKGLNEVLRRIAGGARLLIKMHGDCHQIADRVLLASEYAAAYDDAGLVERFFNRALLNRTLLFLGCGLANDRTITTMKALVAKDGADGLPRHYAFMQHKIGLDRRAVAQHLSQANIFPIWYDGDHDEAIEALLVKLFEPE